MVLHSSNSFYRLLKVLEVLFQMPEFHSFSDQHFMASNYLQAKMISYGGIIKKERRSNFCIVRLKFLPSLLPQRSRDFLKKYFCESYKLRENEFHGFEVEVNLNKEGYLILSDDESKYDELEFYKDVRFHFNFFGTFKDWHKLYKGKRIVVLIPREVESEVDRVMQEVWEKARVQRNFEHVIFLQKLFQFLKDKKLVPVEEGEEVQEFIKGLTFFVLDLLKYNVFPEFQKLKGLKDQDKILQKIGDVSRYNVLVTTRCFRDLLELLIDLLQGQKLKVRNVSFENDSVSFAMRLSPFSASKRVKNFLQKYFGDDLKKCPRGMKHLQAGRGDLLITFTDSRSQTTLPDLFSETDKLIFSVQLKVRDSRDFEYETRTFSFHLNFTSDFKEFKELIKKMREKRGSDCFNGLLDFLTNLKSGNLFAISDNRYQSKLNRLEALSTYDKVYCFKNFCQDLQHFLRRAAGLDNLESLEKSYEVDEIEDKNQWEEMIDEIEGEKFESLLKV